MITSKAWFGVITNENNMSSTFRRILDIKSSYCIVGKIRDHKEDIIIIKFLIIFEDHFDFITLAEKYSSSVYNTIIPVECDRIQYYIDLIKKITYIQDGIDPETKCTVEDERYFSSDDSEFESPSSSESESDEEDLDLVITEDEEEKIENNNNNNV